MTAGPENPPASPLTKNVLMQGAPDGDFMTETRLHFDPHTDNLSAGIAIYSDDHHVCDLIAWNGMLTQVASIRNQITSLPTGRSCAWTRPSRARTSPHALLGRGLPTGVGAPFAGVPSG